MSYPKKTKGYRRITVDGVLYRWRFDTDDSHCAVTFQDGLRTGQQARVTFPDFPNFWLLFPHAPAVRRNSVTPRYIAPLIRLALERGWTPAVDQCWFNLELSWNAFTEQMDNHANLAVSHPPR